MTAPSPPALQCALCWKYQRYEKYERYSRCHPRAYDDPRLNGILPLLPASFLISLSPFLFLFLFFFENLHLVRSSPRLGRKKWDQLSSSVITHFLPPSLSHFRSLECFKHSMREIFARKMEILFTEGVLTRGDFFLLLFEKKRGRKSLSISFGRNFRILFFRVRRFCSGEGERRKILDRPLPKSRRWRGYGWTRRSLRFFIVTQSHARLRGVKIVQYSLPGESRECRCCARNCCELKRSSRSIRAFTLLI